MSNEQAESFRPLRAQAASAATKRPTRVVRRMAKATKQRKPVTPEAAATKISSILAPFTKDQRKATLKAANRILRLVAKLGTSANGK